MTTLVVNGVTYDHAIRSEERLSTFLRDQLGLHGVRVSCNEGECGSCTVLIDGEPVTACMVLARQADGKAVETIEGIGTPDALHPLQQAFIDEQGFQCGFCTPGFILSAKAFLAENPDPTEEEVSLAMSGNICRCGAYPYIVQSVLRAAERMRGDESRVAAAE